MGDDLLVAIARRLESCLRIVDTVARFGGDEFVVLIEDIKDVADATNVAKRIQETLQSPLQLNGHQILIAASIGIVLSSSDYNEPKVCCAMLISPCTMLRNREKLVMLCLISSSH